MSINSKEMTMNKPKILTIISGPNVESCLYFTSHLWEIIVYFRSTINACSLLSHEWWIPLIKFMVGPTIHVRGGSTHLWYSEST